jgi:molybdopterin converting factor subunit 1
LIVQIVLFAAAREIAGLSKLELELGDASKVGDVKQELLNRFPELESVLAKSSFSVNHEFEIMSKELKPGDEVGVIPPVSGG